MTVPGEFCWPPMGSFAWPPSPPGLADTRPRSPGHLRVHRGLLQPRAAAQLARQPHARRIRTKDEGPEPQRHSSGIINLSVKAGQTQGGEGASCARAEDFPGAHLTGGLGQVGTGPRSLRVGTIDPGLA